MRQDDIVNVKFTAEELDCILRNLFIPNDDEQDIQLCDRVIGKITKAKKKVK